VDFVARATPDGELTFVNEAMVRTLGATREEMLNHRWLTEHVHPDDVEMLNAHFATLSSNSPMGVVAHRVILPDGRVRWHEWTNHLIFDASGSLVEMQGTGRDITVRKEAEAALAESETRLRLALRAARGGIYGQLGTGHFSSDEYLRLFGFEPGEVEAGDIAPLAARVHPDDLDGVAAHGREYNEKGGISSFEYRVVLPDGTTRWLRDDTETFPATDATERRFVGVVTDITERKQQELELAQSEERLQLALRAAHAGVWEEMPDGSSYWSAENYCLLGYEPDEVPPTYDAWLARVVPEDLAHIGPTFEKARAGEDSYVVEYRVTHPDGTIHWLRDVAELYRDPQTGQVTRVIGVGTDVTAEKEAAERERQSAARLQLALEAAQAGVWESPAEGGWSYWSDAVYRLIGVEPGALAATGDTWLKAVHPADRRRVAARKKAALTKGVPIDNVYRVVWPDGSTRWLRDLAQPHRDAFGKIDRLIGVTLDVTREREAQEEIRRGRDRLQMALKAADAGAWELLPDGTTTWSDDHYRLLGYQPGEITPSMETIMHAVMPADLVEKAPLLQQVLTGGGRFDEEFRIVRPDGSVRWLRDIGQSYPGEQPGTMGFTGILMDVTERRETQEAIRRSEERLRLALEAARAGAWEGYPAEGRSVWTDENYRILGYTPGVDEASYVNWEARLHPADRDRVVAAQLRASEVVGPFDFEYRLLLPDGTVRWVRDIGESRPNPNGEGLLLSAIVLDSTTEKEAQEASRRSEERLRLALRAARAGAWDLSVDKVGTWSDDHYLLLGLTPGEVQPSAQAFFNLIHPDDREAAVSGMNQAMATGSRFDLEMRVVRKDGAIRWIRDIGEPFA
ncbi:MAG: PAS domain-containing protein, partial [Anaerolineae bacterium]|nr:PAS domain-containing protein [Anaerolineae bacterium]